ncbi:hypothetical protein DY000_02002284 [Brassica cretica]|uniref:Uncharacterized protein n=1 Tax=Brassica cretica TaxID=69181 RepID=A0ABQ7CGI1_BRACR|nr:hypothetical protein DY000_02002284 [Brassica cretica]
MVRDTAVNRADWWRLFYTAEKEARSGAVDASDVTMPQYWRRRPNATAKRSRKRDLERQRLAFGVWRSETAFGIQKSIFTQIFTWFNPGLSY